MKFILNGKRGVSPVIGMLLIIAVTVIGSTIFFTQTEAIINNSQVSSYPLLDFVKIVGYDARDTLSIETFEGTYTSIYSGGINDGVKGIGERVGIHLQNHAVNQVMIKELRFGGNIYRYTQGSGTLDTVFTGLSPSSGQYTILVKSPNILKNSPTPVIESGESVTVVVSLDEKIKIGKDIQVKLTSNNGAISVGTVVIGDYR